MPNLIPLEDPEDQAALIRAIQLLERRSFAIRIAEYTGQPINKVLGRMPKIVTHRVNAAVHTAMTRCLNLAVRSLDPDATGPALRTLPKLMTGVTGGLGGLFGFISLPIELPLTTTLMLTSIADIARSEGEDLSNLAARLSCLEVFALGGRGPHPGPQLGYFASRAFLAKLMSDTASYLVQRQAAEASAPAIARMLAEIVTRFGIIVSEKAAASAVPVLGALGGATINMIFIDHFQKVATGHFAVRRLERKYGAARVHQGYQSSLPTTPGLRSLTI